MALVQTGVTPGQREATRLREQLDATVSVIRANDRLSPTGQQQQIANAWLSTRDAVAKVQEDERKATDARKFQLERDLFGLPGRADGSEAISYRDAQDRVRSISDDDHNAPSRALSLLAQAERSGDTHLSKALVQSALENGWREVLQMYSQAHPADAARLEELTSLSGQGRSSQGIASIIAAGMVYDVPKPREIESFNDYNVQQLGAS